MSPAIFRSLTLSLGLAVLTLGTAATADQFRDIRGVWSGTYKVAFPAGHPKWPDSAVDTEMELDVYKQDGHLFWVINRWRHIGDADWVTEYGTGSFNLDDRDDLTISEAGPAPTPDGTTGKFIGEFDDGFLYLNYIGPGNGVSFAVELRKQ